MWISRQRREERGRVVSGIRGREGSDESGPRRWHPDNVNFSEVPLCILQEISV